LIVPPIPPSPQQSLAVTRCVSGSFTPIYIRLDIPCLSSHKRSSQDKNSKLRKPPLMTAEDLDEDNASEYGSPVTVKQEEFAFPLSPSSNVSDPSTPLTTFPYSITPHLVSPSQLILSDIVVKRSCPSSPASSSMSGSVEPATKKTKRKPRTEEEKEARANERIMRNRRAAQESRDRKKRQFEALEEENRQLQEEREQLNQRIDQLELRLQKFQSDQPFNSLLPTYETHINSPPSPFSETTPPEDSDIIKSEVFSPPSFAATFHPAVVNDQQCPLSKSWRITNFLMSSC
jgi:hypothetical protein